MLAFDITFAEESSGPEAMRPMLHWARSDAGTSDVLYVKDRFLGGERDADIEVLTEFYADISEVQVQGMLLAHNLSYKSAVLMAQFSKRELATLAARWWAHAQRAGFCLMSGELGSWLDVPSPDHCMSVVSLCRKLKLDDEPEMRECGALLCLRILSALRELARPPCARGEALHDFAMSRCCYMRDNGEAPAGVCRLCGHVS